MKLVSRKLTQGYVRVLRQAAFAVLLSLFASQSFAQRPAEGPFVALPGSLVRHGYHRAIERN